MNYIELLESLLNSFVNLAILLFEYIGVAVITYSGLQGLVNYVRRHSDTRLVLAKGLAMGLEFKLGSEILRTVVVRSMSEIYIVASIVALRAILTILIHWEIKNEEKDNPVLSPESAKDTAEELPPESAPASPSAANLPAADMTSAKSAQDVSEAASADTTAPNASDTNSANTAAPNASDTNSANTTAPNASDTNSANTAAPAEAVSESTAAETSETDPAKLPGTDFPDAAAESAGFDPFGETDPIAASSADETVASSGTDSSDSAADSAKFDPFGEIDPIGAASANESAASSGTDSSDAASDSAAFDPFA